MKGISKMLDYKDLNREIIQTDLCTGCGTCIGACPKRVFDWDNGVKAVRTQDCIHCGICVNSCPGKSMNFIRFNNKNSESKQVKKSKWLGNYYGLYAAKSNIPEIRMAGASGGIVTQIALALLEKGIVQGVITVRNTKNREYDFETIIATSRDEIMSSTGSKYSIIPHNEVIEQIKRFPGKVLYIGLPCQLHGLHKAMKLDQRLKEKVYLSIGIFCGFNMRDDAKQYLISKSEIKKEDITHFNFRAKKNNQSGLQIKGKGGKEFYVNKHAYTFLNLFFVPKRCTLCYDYAAELADISVGDAWEETGTSRVIVRSLIGMEIFNTLIEEKYIVAKECLEEAVLTNQNNVIHYKKDGIIYRLKMSRYIPDYQFEWDTIRGKQKYKQLILAIIIKIFSSSFGRILLKIIPFSLFVKMSEKLKGKEIGEKVNERIN